MPELAARRHVTAIIPVVEQALIDAGIERDDLDAIAATQGPGLAGSLVVGLNTAKAMAYALDRPLVAVNHLEAHIYANWLVDTRQAPDPPAFPILCLWPPAATTELNLDDGHGSLRHLGRTLDALRRGRRSTNVLACLASTSPVAQRYTSAAASGNALSVELPRAWLPGTHDFSFSGLKTALLRLSEPFVSLTPKMIPPARRTFHGAFRQHRAPVYVADAPIADFAAAFQEAVVEPLAVKAARPPLSMRRRPSFSPEGVAANALLRQRLADEVSRLCSPETPVICPPLAYCNG